MSYLFCSKDESVCVNRLMRDKERREGQGQRAQISEVEAFGRAPTLPCLRFSWSALVQADKMAPGKESTCPLIKFMIQQACQQLSLKKKKFIYFSNSETFQLQMVLFYIGEKPDKWLQMVILSVAWLVMFNLSHRNRRYFPNYFPPLSKLDHWVVCELHSQLCCFESMKLSKRGIRDKRRHKSSWRLCQEYKLSTHSLLLGKQRWKDYKFRGRILELMEQLPVTTMKTNPAWESLESPSLRRA